MRSNLQKYLYETGLFLFLIPCLVLVIGTLFLCIGLPLIGIILPLSCLGAAFWVLKTSVWEEKWKRSLISFGIGLTALFFSMLIAGMYFDCSFDGQWYHQDAIMFLAEGWNPVWDAEIPNNLVSGLNANYVNHYPKMSWIVEAVFFNFSGNIEHAKSLHLLFATSAFLLGFDFLVQRVLLSPWKAILISLLLNTSTITLGQMFSFYVDGILYSLLLLFIIFLIGFVFELPRYNVYLLLSFIGLANIKFTGLIYGIVLLFFAWLWVVLYKKKRVLSLSVGFLFLILIGAGMIGYPTYVRNTISKGHPFFPIMGKHNEGKMIAEVQYPKDFFNRTRVEKLIRAHGSIPLYTDHEHASVTKPLFNSGLIKNSLAYYRNHQPVTMSPFGPIEAELWLVFIPLLILCFLLRPPVEWWWVMSALIISLLIQPECWNLRYSPQLLLIIALVMVPIFIKANRWITLAASVFIVVFIFNGWFAVRENWRWVHDHTQMLNKELEPLRNKSVVIQAGWMHSFSLKLKTYRISPQKNNTSSEDLVPFKGDDFTGWKHKK